MIKSNQGEYKLKIINKYFMDLLEQDIAEYQIGQLKILVKYLDVYDPDEYEGDIKRIYDDLKQKSIKRINQFMDNYPKFKKVDLTKPSTFKKRYYQKMKKKLEQATKTTQITTKQHSNQKILKQSSKNSQLQNQLNRFVDSKHSTDQSNFIIRILKFDQQLKETFRIEEQVKQDSLSLELIKIYQQMNLQGNILEVQFVYSGIKLPLRVSKKGSILSRETMKKIINNNSLTLVMEKLEKEDQKQLMKITQEDLYQVKQEKEFNIQEGQQPNIIQGQSQSQSDYEKSNSSVSVEQNENN